MRKDCPKVEGCEKYGANAGYWLSLYLFLEGYPVPRALRFPSLLLVQELCDETAQFSCVFSFLATPFQECHFSMGRPYWVQSSGFCSFKKHISNYFAPNPVLSDEMRIYAVKIFEVAWLLVNKPTSVTSSIHIYRRFPTNQWIVIANIRGITQKGDAPLLVPNDRLTDLSTQTLIKIACMDPPNHQTTKHHA
jgi:hypothetical protein